MKTVSTILNLAVLALTLVMMSLALAFPAHAATKGYSAVLATPAPASKMIVNDTLWKCDGTTCRSGTESGSRADIVCAVLVKKTGAVVAFSANGAAFDAARLEKCNAKAKKA